MPSEETGLVIMGRTTADKKIKWSESNAFWTCGILVYFGVELVTPGGHWIELFPSSLHSEV